VTEFVTEAKVSEEIDVAQHEMQHPEDVPAETKRLTRRALLLRRFLRNRTAVVGLVVFALLIIFASVGGHLSNWSYAQVDRKNFLKGPSGQHWFGTTQAGRDIFAMTVHGLQKSLIIGVVVAVVSTSVAAVVGSFAAYFGGILERVSLWIIDLLLVLPSFLLIAIVMSGSKGDSGGLLLLIILLAAFNWMLSARVVRSLTQSVKDRDYVLAAKYMGVSGPKIVFRHILPNISSLLIIDATLNVAGAVLAETGLSFFGFGIQSPDTSLGTLIAQGQAQATTFPWTFLAPSVFLVLMVVSVNFIGDGLRDALDPTSLASGKAG
jgi:peptide/nickel transport system permease protein